VNKHIKNRLLIRSIEAHKRILVEGQNVDLASIFYEEGTPFERVHEYNAFTILTKLQFPKDEVLNNESKSRQYLDEIALKDLPTEEIIQLLIEYRNEIANS